MNKEESFRPPPYQKRSLLYARFVEKLRYFVRTPQRSSIAGFCGVVLTYAAVYNIVARFIYGNDHPINRFTWRRMERNGQLSEELLEKQRILNSFYQNNILNTHLLKWHNDRYPDLSSFHKMNYD